MPMPETPNQTDKPPKLVIAVSGGNIQGMSVSKNFPAIDIVVIDHDNIEAEGIDSDSANDLHDRATEDAQDAISWRDHKEFLEGEDE